MPEFLSLRGLTWGELAKRTCRESWDDGIFAQSARLSFYFFFALFPVLLLLLILLNQSTGAGSELRGAVVDYFQQVLPADAATLIAKTIRQLGSSSVLGAGAVFAAGAAVWAALNGTWAIVTGLNAAYEVKEERPWWHILWVTVGLTVSLSILGLIALAALLSGHRLGDVAGQHRGMGAHLEVLWLIVRWAAIAIPLLFSFALLYRFGPNLKDRRWQWSIPGAIIAVLLWIAATLLLQFYQEHFRASQRSYAGLSAVATLLMWFYLTGAVIFIGGEANSEIEKAAAEAGNPEARKPDEPRSGED